ncbi:MAG: VanZ family protein [Bacteroidetes bacterium]|nr:MAG: VanZ family protein [Bacteroidota bacterium]
MNVSKQQSNNSESSPLTKRITLVLFVMYAIALIWILLLKLGVQFSYMETRSVNVIPFREAFLFNGRIDYSEIIMNVVVFVPLGIYAGMLFRRWAFWKNLLFFFLTSCMVEVIQWLLKIGAFDVTDMITNTSGGILGFVICKVIEKLFNNQGRAHGFINIMAGIGTVLMLLFLILLKTNRLGIRYQ